MTYITNAEVGKHLVAQPSKMDVVLFGKGYKVYNDEWRNHLHIICTYQCNAKCDFCVEKDSVCELSPEFLPNVKAMLAEMHREGILHTVSITGGEPTVFKQIVELVEAVKVYDVFLTINTNGVRLNKLASKLNGKVDCINISRHYVDDRKNLEVFKAYVPTTLDLMALRMKYPDTKFRIQAVVNESTNLQEFSTLYELGIVDDLSFRQLMLDGSKESKENRNLYLALVAEAVEEGELIEQEVQDYYVYETHLVYGVEMTFSYSNMKLLEQEEAKEEDNFIREFIIQPNGDVGGSWFNGKSIK